ncbi:unnamed protein product [Auanema sp. JU1783]|nr:unnamed protein product [Auanema sp. JU1783]
MLAHKLKLLVLVSLLSFEVGAIDARSRVDCFPDPGASQQACLARNCVWEPAANSDPTETPWCYFPTETGYRLNGNKLYPVTTNPFGDNLGPLDFTSTRYGATLSVSIGQNGRYVPPIGIPRGPSSASDTFTLQKDTIPNSSIFYFKIIRSSTKDVIFDTSIGGMLFADKFIQIATKLQTDQLFGFGDHIHHQLKHDFSRYTTWPMFARDIAPDSESKLSTQNLYGVQPFYIAVETSGSAHGVLLLNSNAQEVTTGPGPHLIYRTIGGQLELVFFPGPTPEKVVQQYLAFIGTPFLPAYWALGFQLCRWGYKDLNEMKAVVARTQAAGIPLDIPYADIDYMSHDMDFTEGDDWSGFPAYAAQLHQEGLHLILIFDPAIEVDYGSFQRARDQNASFIEWNTLSEVPRNVEDLYPLANNSLIMLGNVWPERNTAFPDFLDPTNNTQNWWISEFVKFHDNLPFDGIWIDMNEPSNFDTDTYSSVGKNRATAHLACPISGTDSQFDNPPYKTKAVFLHDGEQLCSKTLCMLGRTARRSARFYDTKNLYGWSEARSTALALKAATGKRGAVISRSTFVSSGRYGGHWLGDNTARWSDLQTSVIGVMEFNFFGIPYVGSDICGFIGTTTEELCLRWQQMGAFHPFSRNHNTQGAPAQDPAVWPSVAKAARIALLFRYQYLPYLYSLMFYASSKGATVIRPLFFEFPTDTYTMEVDHQFLWGSGLMIAPCVEEGAKSVRVYFPSDTWYSLVPESYGQEQSVGLGFFPAPWDSLTPVFARGGNILPRQAPNTTTTLTRKNPLEILIATRRGKPSATGTLFWDNGDDAVQANGLVPHYEINFSYYSTSTAVQLEVNCIQTAESVAIPSLAVIEILGYDFTPDFNSFKANGKTVLIDQSTSSYNKSKRVLYVKASNILTNMKSSTTISWNHSV